jgi:hypothetical protein
MATTEAGNHPVKIIARTPIASGKYRLYSLLYMATTPGNTTEARKTHIMLNPQPMSIPFNILPLRNTYQKAMIKPAVPQRNDTT